MAGVVVWCWIGGPSDGGKVEEEICLCSVLEGQFTILKRHFYIVYIR